MNIGTNHTELGKNTPKHACTFYMKWYL